jgi:hypothetical protein
MSSIYVQGDLLIRKIDDVPVSGTVIPPDPDGATVLGRGEVTGHRHAFYGGALMFRDDALAAGMPADLYIGHFKLEAPAKLEHEEHAPISLGEGTYVASRQREYDPRSMDENEARTLIVND